jgi:hypothetical protein
VQVLGCSALLRLSSLEAGWGIFFFSGPGDMAETKARILAGGAAALVHQALAAFPGDDVLQHDGKRLLGTLSVGR